MAKRAILAFFILVLLAGCSKQNDLPQAQPITGEVTKEAGKQAPVEQFTGETYDLAFGKTYKKSDFGEGTVQKIRFERTYLPVNPGDKVIIRNLDAGDEIIQIGKLGSTKESNQLVFERAVNDGDEFGFIFKYPGLYQVICKKRGCIARVEVK